MQKAGIEIRVGPDFVHCLSGGAGYKCKWRDKEELAPDRLGRTLVPIKLKSHVLEEGLILLAAYSTSDLSAVPVRVLSVYGSCDEVLDMEAYKENSVNLPPETNEYIIDGGCHAYFGSYGAQKGDGKPEITDEKQIELTSEKIIEFID